MSITRFIDFGAITVTLFENTPLELENGGTLSNLRVTYHSYGTPQDTAYLVCHALTGSSAAHLWWWELFEVGNLLDPQIAYTLCINVLGSCYGSSGAQDFGILPITIGDMVQVQAALLERLGVKKVRVLGGSMGGMQALEWVRRFPERLEKAAIIGSPQAQTVWSAGFNVVARAIIQNDPAWQNGNYTEQPRSMGLARMIGMLTYRSPQSLQLEQSGPSPTQPHKNAIETYLHYQAEKLLERFDANCYLLLMKAMDAFKVDSSELQGNFVPTLVVGISSDVRYPPQVCRDLAANLGASHYWELESMYGHDAFLVETIPLEERLRAFFAD
jgi:homoserine O-acetyltransferase/O-succinyltransferase